MKVTIRFFLQTLNMSNGMSPNAGAVPVFGLSIFNNFFPSLRSSIILDYRKINFYLLYYS